MSVPRAVLSVENFIGYAGGSVAAGRICLSGQAERYLPDDEACPGPPRVDRTSELVTSSFKINIFLYLKHERP
jgi:hypothetical protein